MDTNGEYDLVVDVDRRTFFMGLGLSKLIGERRGEVFVRQTERGGVLGQGGSGRCGVRPGILRSLLAAREEQDQK